MPLSNTTITTLSSGPYWDDFDATKNYHRVLIKPKFPVQARELNQMQSIAQHQVGELVAGVFKEGRAVSGGEATFSNTVISLQLVRSDVDVALFYDATTGIGWTAKGLTSQAVGRVVQYSRQPGETYTAVVVSPISAEQFIAGETVSFISPSNDAQSMVLSSEVPTKNAAIYAVQSGTFHLRGHLVHVPQQTVVLSTTTNQVTSRVGFRVTEEVVTSAGDSSLLDPAFGTTNYAAPGADRLKLTATLVAKDTLTTTDQDFIEIARIVGGVPVTPVDRLVPEFIEETLARRTYDESGDYVVRPFRLSVKDHNPTPGVPNVTGRISGNTSHTIVSGVDTLFSTEIKTGDVLIVNGDRREVDVISSNTQMTVNAAFSLPFDNVTFTVASSAKMNMELEAGKAYVRGVEFETSGTSILEASRPRTSFSQTNDSISSFYGPYTYVKRPEGNAQLLDINTLQKVALHCVAFENVQSGTSKFDTTKIGSAYIRGFQYQSGSGDAQTTYRAYLVGAEFETKTFTVDTSLVSSNTKPYSLVLNTTSNTVTLKQNVTSPSTTANLVFALVEGAYIGSTVALETSGGGAQRYTITDSNTVVVGTEATLTLKLDTGRALDTCKTGQNANCVLIFSDKAIRGISNVVAKTHGLTVDRSAKVSGAEKGETIFYGTDSTSSAFRYPFSWIVAETSNNHVFSGVRKITATAGYENATHAVYSLDLSTYAEDVYNTPQTIIFRDIQVTNSTNGLVSINAASSVIRNINGSTAQLLLANSVTGGDAITVYLRTDVDGQPTPKTLVYGNTDPSSVAQTAGVLQSDLGRGHVAVNTINVASPRIVSLGIPDVYALKAVYAYSNPADVLNNSNRIDVTNRYTLDSGQRDWCYDHASLVLKPGQQHYTGANNILAIVDYFQHTTNAHAYFTAHSYTSGGFPYEDIPNFTDPASGRTIALRDSVDFRAVRTANTASANSANNPYVSANATFTSQLLPISDGTIITNYEFYLPRIDRVVITRDRQMRVVQGIPDISPKPPSDVDDGITLYMVTYPPYLSNTASAQIQPIDHRRYTMRDIGKLEKRIEHLEYYVQLSLLEERTLNEPEYDDNNIERFKHGILIDPFTSSSVANPFDVDYRVSIDEGARQLRPSFISYGYNLGKFVPIDPLNLNGSFNTVNKNGAVMLEYSDYVPPTSAAQQDLSAPRQPLASKLVNVNPFNVSAWVGSVTLSPDRDVWFDTITKDPTVTINLYGENDSFEAQPLGTLWNDWESKWHGTETTSLGVTSSFAAGMWDPDDSSSLAQWATVGLEQTKVVDTFDKTRTGMQIAQKFSKADAIVGNKLVGMEVIPFMRPKNIRVSAVGMRPGSEIRAFFDEQDVTSFVERAAEIQIVPPAGANATSLGFTVGSTVNSGDGNASAVIAGIVGNRLYVVDVDPTSTYTGKFSTLSGSNTVSQQTATGTIVATIGSYYQWSGKISTGTTSSIFTLAPGTTGTDLALVGKTISITKSSVSGLAGQSRTITGYTSAGVVTVDPPFSTIPAQGDTYALGPLETHPLPVNLTTAIIDGYTQPGVNDVNPGAFYGLFRLPAGQFSTGRRTFRLGDKSSVSDTATKAEGFYEASGTLATQEAIRVQTRNVSIERTPVREEQRTEVVTVNSSLSVEFSGVYIDPLAQTFMVDPDRFPRGMFITSIDLFFGRIDVNRSAPVRVQIRPTVNGYPSSDAILPHAEASLYPTNVVPVNVTPNATNPDHRTRFEFPRPIHVQAGVEYAMVILSDSFDYEVFVGEIGQQIIGSTSLISEQPYGGSLFKSQNARTWTPVQEEDLMFVINRAVFVTTGTARFDLSDDSRSSVQQALLSATSRYMTPAALSTIDYSESVANVVADVTTQATLDPPPTVQTRRALETALQLYGDFDYDVFYLNAEYVGWDPAEYYIRLTQTSNVPDSSWSVPVLRPGQNMNLGTRRRIMASNTSGSVRFTSAMKTSDPAVSPIYDLDNLSFVAIRNLIDDGQLYANGFYVERQGVNTAAITSNTLNLTITEPNATTTATAIATVNSTGKIVSFTVTSPGAGYLATPTITCDQLSSFSTTPIIKYRGETDAKVDIIGEEKARYISRRVKLADGFDARDLKVYISANRPAGSNIDVYYKILGTGDRTNFDDRPWTLLPISQDKANVYSTDGRQFREFVYRTQETTNNGTRPKYSVDYTSNGVTYSTFHTFAIKIVLRTTNPNAPPILRNLRVIALDA